MERRKMLGVFAITLAAIIVVSGVVAAYGGFGFGKNLSGENRENMLIQQEAMQRAVSEGNLSAWKSLMYERIAEMQLQLTEENFNAIVEKHNTMAEFRESRPKSFGEFKGRGFGKAAGMGCKTANNFTE